MADLDAYGNELPKGTPQQLAKENATYWRIARELQAEHDASVAAELRTGRLRDPMLQRDL